LKLFIDLWLTRHKCTKYLHDTLPKMSVRLNYDFAASAKPKTASWKTWARNIYHYFCPPSKIVKAIITLCIWPGPQKQQQQQKQKQKQQRRPKEQHQVESSSGFY